ncbi:dethiobiotin synthase [Neisseria leonii]|uniref:ATP-dependent dethiobiotin synthetase BioD n=1 Tax=Neisseria leonii TaxID=2995413 RepID=A0A9X4E383_9NEIS|nr:dethiobiotin synthase [Neisseria sp. 51.81]MDD9328394.1 dethiobiotin synthase [Neisseria sp. 51.81]
MTAKTFFVAGTDTDAGKTLCSTALLRAWVAAGYRAAGFKPVASGAADGRNADVLALQAASSQPGAYADHNAYTFAEATAPHLAAAGEGRRIDTDALNRKLRYLQQSAELVLAEGAGGWLTPLDGRRTLADWAADHALPVVLVVGMKLGCLNHTLLTAAAVAQSGLPLAGWIANCPTAQPHRLADYVADLSQRLPAPLLGVVPYLPQAGADRAAAYLADGAGYLAAYPTGCISTHGATTTAHIS